MPDMPRLTPHLRTLMNDALTDTIADGGMFADGSHHYLTRLAATKDGQFLGDLIDVVNLFDLPLA